MEIEKYYFLCVFAFHASKQPRILNVRMLQGLGLMENDVFCVPNIFTDAKQDVCVQKREPKNKLHYYLYGFQFNNFFKFISQILLSVMYIIGSWGHERDVLVRRHYSSMFSCFMSLLTVEAWRRFLIISKGWKCDEIGFEVFSWFCSNWSLILYASVGYFYMFLNYLVV